MTSIDRRAFFTYLGGSAAVATLGAEAKADALAHLAHGCEPR